MYILNSKYPSRFLMINSNYATSYTSPNLLTSFEYQFEPIECNQDCSFLVSLSSCSIPYSFYGCSNATNKLDVVESDSNNDHNINISLPVGNYNAIEFAKMVSSQLTSHSHYGITYSITYDKNQNKFHFSISSQSGDYFTSSFLFESGENASQSCCDLLGFFSNKDIIMNTQSQQGIDSDKSIMMNPTLNLFVKSDIISYMYICSSELDNVLASIPINCQPNSVIHYTNFEGNRFLLSPKVFNRIMISLVDERNNVIDTNGLGFNLTLRFDIIDNEPNKIHNNDDVRKQTLNEESNLAILSKMNLTQPEAYSTFGPSPNLIISALKQAQKLMKIKKRRRLNNREKNQLNEIQNLFTT